MMRLQARTHRWAALALAVVMIGGCATGSASKRGDAAVKRGEWDAAVGYYREALAKKPRAIDVQISLERATREASNQHVARAKELDKQDQLSGAAAEYRLAIEFDPSNTLALTRALEIERRMRDLAEASRPKTRMEEMRAQAANASPIPRLDPRQPLQGIKFNSTAVRDVLAAIGLATGIGIQYDQGLEPSITRPFTVDLTGHSLESAFNMVLSQNTLTYKILDSHTIFIYQDNAGQRAKYEDQYQQTYYLSHGDVQEVVTILNQMLTTTTAGNRPVITQNKSANAIVVRATAPMLGLIKNIVDTADKPKAEVLIEVTILEVSRTRLKDLGIDLSSYALGLTFSPTAVPTGGAVLPPTAPGPINVADLGGSLTKSSFYATIPSAVVKLMESDQHTRLLAKPQLRGREGSQLTLNLGDSIPVPQTSFLPTATGGVPTQPQVSYAYQPVGVNLTITPKVTYNDEIILDPITVDKSGLGADIIVAGQSLPTFVKRTAQVSMRLRDGESNMLAGLIKDEDKELGKSLPFITRVPILRSIFGNVNSSNEQSDIVMIVTPHIIRSREITTEDLKPFYVGTQNNLGAGNAPGLISQVPPPALTQTGQGVPPPPGGATVGIPPTGAQPPAGTPPMSNPVGNPTTPPAQGAVPPVGAAPPPQQGRAVGIEPVQNAAGAPADGPVGQILLTVPAGELQVGGAPYVVPVSITGVSQVGAVTLTITYDPKILKATNVSEGTFMRQGGITPTFVPKIDAAAGRIDIAISRGGTAPGASGTNLLAGVAFEAIGAGKSAITVTGSAFTPAGQAIKVTLPAAGSVIVK